MGWLRRIDRARGGVWVDVGLYAFSAMFAAWTAAASTLAPHRAWGAVAVWGYGVAMVAAVVSRQAWYRAAVAGAAWIATCLLPLCLLAVARAGGRLDRAQEEVLVIEDGGRRLLETGTPYLSRAEISHLADPLLGYLPYQPGMAIFGVPRGLDSSAAAWSDARVWFALATVAALAGALLTLLGAGAAPAGLVRALQAVTVLPVAALTLATGGDDLPVLTLCLLGFALAATKRPGWAGIAIGAAAAMKLFAWPVALVLGAYLVTTGRRDALRYLAGAVTLPVVTALPALWLGAGALVENVIAFPFGQGLVSSPAASPLPGRLIATTLPAGDVVAKVLVGLAVVVILAWLIRRPPRSAASAAWFSGWALLAAMMLLPSSRFGYLLYPLALLLWVPALASVPSGDFPGRSSPGVTRSSAGFARDPGSALDPDARR